MPPPPSAWPPPLARPRPALAPHKKERRNATRHTCCRRLIARPPCMRYCNHNVPTTTDRLCRPQAMSILPSTGGRTCSNPFPSSCQGIAASVCETPTPYPRQCTRTDLWIGIESRIPATAPPLSDQRTTRERNRLPACPPVPLPLPPLRSPVPDRCFLPSAHYQQCRSLSATRQALSTQRSLPIMPLSVCLRLPRRTPRRDVMPTFAVAFCISPRRSSWPSLSGTSSLRWKNAFSPCVPGKRDGQSVVPAQRRKRRGRTKRGAGAVVGGGRKL